MGCVNEKVKLGQPARKVVPSEEFGLKKQDSDLMFDRGSPKGLISRHLKKRNQRNSNTTINADTLNVLSTAFKDMHDKRTSVATNMPINLAAIIAEHEINENFTSNANAVAAEIEEEDTD